MANTPPKRWRACENIEERIADDRGLCRIGDEAVPPQFLLWGDSHARSWASAVNVSAQRKNKSGYLASKTACAPLLGIERQGRKKCLKFNETVFSFIEGHAGIGTVILSARWGLAAEGSRYKEEDGDPIVLIDTLATAGQPEHQHELTANALYRTVLSLQAIGKRVLVVGPVPEVGYDVPSVNHIALITNRDVNSMIAPSRSDFESRNKNVLSILSRLRDELHVKILSPSTLLCDETICRVALEGGIALYRDDHHLSTFGAKSISELFDAEFDDRETAADELPDDRQ